MTLSRTINLPSQSKPNGYPFAASRPIEDSVNCEANRAKRVESNRPRSAIVQNGAISA